MAPLRNQGLAPSVARPCRGQIRQCAYPDGCTPRRSRVGSPTRKSFRTRLFTACGGRSRRFAGFWGSPTPPPETRARSSSEGETDPLVLPFWSVDLKVPLDHSRVTLTYRRAGSPGNRRPNTLGSIRVHDMAFRGETAGGGHVASPAANRRPDKNSSRRSGFRYRVARSTTTGVIARSRLTTPCASSSRPIWA
jgi:hypothetical protein